MKIIKYYICAMIATMLLAAAILAQMYVNFTDNMIKKLARRKP